MTAGKRWIAGRSQQMATNSSTPIAAIVAASNRPRRPRSVADSSSPATLAKVREWKQAQRAARLDKQDRALTTR